MLVPNVVGTAKGFDPNASAFVSCLTPPHAVTSMSFRLTTHTGRVLVHSSARRRRLSISTSRQCVLLLLQPRVIDRSDFDKLGESPNWMTSPSPSLLETFKGHKTVFNTGLTSRKSVLFLEI